MSKKPAAPIVTKQCAHCGATFETRNLKKKFCNNECYLEFNRNRVRAYYAKKKATTKPPRILKCAQCGAEFIARSSRQYCCSSRCCIKYRLARKSEAAAEKRKKVRNETDEETRQRLAESCAVEDIHIGEPSPNNPGYDIAPDGRTLVRIRRDKWHTTRTEIRR